jgi:hypothetical protein
VWVGGSLALSGKTRKRERKREAGPQGHRSKQARIHCACHVPVLASDAEDGDVRSGGAGDFALFARVDVVAYDVDFAAALVCGHAGDEAEVHTETSEGDVLALAQVGALDASVLVIDALERGWVVDELTMMVFSGERFTGQRDDMLVKGRKESISNGGEGEAGRRTCASAMVVEQTASSWWWYFFWISGKPRSDGSECWGMELRRTGEMQETSPRGGYTTCTRPVGPGDERYAAIGKCTSFHLRNRAHAVMTFVHICMHASRSPNSSGVTVAGRLDVLYCNR